MGTEAALARDYVSRINEQAARAVIEIIRTGDLLTEAKAKLPHGMFERMFEDSPNRLPDYVHMSSRHGRTFMSIAASTAIRDNADRLSVNIKALAQIARLPDCDAQELIDAGVVNKNTTTSQAKRVVSEKLTGPKSEPGFRIDNQPVNPGPGSIWCASANRNPHVTKSEPDDVASSSKTDIANVARDELPESWQSKYDRALKKALKEMQDGFYQAVKSEVASSLASAHQDWQRKIKFAEKYASGNRHEKFPFTSEQFKTIRNCLHPDRVQDASLKQVFSKAFSLLNDKRDSLVMPEPPTGGPPFPATPDALMTALKKKPAKEKTQ